MSRERNPFRGIRLFIIGYFALLILVLTFVGVMDWLGYRLTDLSLEFALFALLVCSALVALAVWLCRRIPQKWLQVVVGSISGMIVVAAAMGIMMVYSLTALYSMPVHYTTIASPAGEKAVVMRTLSRDMEAVAARTRLRLGEEADGEDPVLGDLAYEYVAYPEVARFFYNAKIRSAGSVEIGCESEAALMYEWTDDRTLHMYIENPEPYDQGELELIFP